MYLTLQRTILHLYKLKLNIIVYSSEVDIKVGILFISDVPILKYRYRHQWYRPIFVVSASSIGKYS